jgi:hypothetical protein
MKFFHRDECYPELRKTLRLRHRLNGLRITRYASATKPICITATNQWKKTIPISSSILHASFHSTNCFTFRVRRRRLWQGIRFCKDALPDSCFVAFITGMSVNNEMGNAWMKSTWSILRCQLSICLEERGGEEWQKGTLWLTDLKKRNPRSCHCRQRFQTQ